MAQISYGPGISRVALNAEGTQAGENPGDRTEKGQPGRDPRRSIGIRPYRQADERPDRLKRTTAPPPQIRARFQGSAKPRAMRR